MLSYLDKENKIAYRFNNYYDLNHNKTKTVHSDGMEELFKYDTKNKLIRYDVIDQSDDDNNYFETYERDYLANMVRTKRSNGREIVTYYNMIMQPVSIADSLGNTSIYFYDELYRCIRIEDSKGNIEIYDYDRFGNLIHHKKEPVLYEEWWRYDKLNNLIEYKNTNDVVIFYTNSNGLKVKEYNSFTDITIHYNYDDNRRLTYSLDSKGKEDAYIYDTNGNIKKHEDEYYIREYKYNEYNKLVEYIRKVK